MDPLTITTGIITLYTAVWQLEKLRESYTNVPEVIESLGRDCDLTLTIILHTKYRLDWHDRHPTPNDFVNPIDIREKMRKIIAVLHPEVETLKTELTKLLRPPETNYDYLKSKLVKVHHLHHLAPMHRKIGERLVQFERLKMSMDGENIDWLRRNSVTRYNLLGPTLSVTESVSSKEGTEILLRAITSARQNDVVVILRMLGVDPNLKDAETGMYPLHVATARGDFVIIEELLDCGAAPDAQDKHGKTALHIATRKDFTTGVELLLYHQASPNAKDREGRTPLWYAARHGDSPNTFQILIQANTREIDIINYRCDDPDMPTALWAAAASHHLSTFEALLQAGARTEELNDQGDTLLHRAAWPIATAMVPLLLDRGADILARDQNGKLPLHRAAAVGKTGVVDALLKRMDNGGVDEQDGEGATALIRAAQSGSLPLMRCLTEKWKANCSVQDQLGNRAFHYACANGHILVVAYLLGLGADINEGNKEGNTPLHIAAKCGNSEIVSLLLQLGVDSSPRSCQEASGIRRELPTEVARAAGHEDIARMIETFKLDDES